MVSVGALVCVLMLSSPALSKKKKPQPTLTPTLTPTPTPTPEVKVWNFDQDKADTVASGWKAIEGDWTVIPDPSAPSQPNTFGLPEGRMMSTLIHALNYYPIAIESDAPDYGDFTLEASFKSAGGRFDCSGGIIFRYVDSSNYYVLSQGCPSDFFTLTRVSNGAPSVLQQKVVPTDKDVWYKIKVVAEGDHFTCYSDNKMVFDFNDNKIAKGKIGLWASDDSQARFDNVTITLPLAGAGGGEAAPAEAASPAAAPSEPSAPEPSAPAAVPSAAAGSPPPLPH
jgi:hypothetical protein